MPSVIVRTDNWPHPSWDFQDRDDTGALLWNEDGSPTIMDLTGSAFVVTITGPGLRMVLTTADEDLDVDLETNRLSWPITLAQAKKFPEDKPAAYTIQRIIDGKYQTLWLDTFTGRAGPNNGGHATVLLAGPVGATGDVTPEATAAKEDAEAAAGEAAASALSMASAVKRTDALGRSLAPQTDKRMVLNMRGGGALESLPAGRADARDVVDSLGRTIQTTDTVSSRRNDYFTRVFRKGLMLGGALADGVLGDAQGVTRTVGEAVGDVSLMVRGEHNFLSRLGRRLLGMSGPGGYLVADLPTAAPPEVGGVWAPRPGAVETVPEQRWENGRYARIGMVQPTRTPPCTAMPLIVYAADDTEDRDVALYELGPAITWVPGNTSLPNGRLWVGFVRNNVQAAEGLGSYQVFKFSDDQGATWSDDVFYIVSPDDSTHLINDIQMWTDPWGRVHIFTCIALYDGSGDPDNCPYITIIPNPLQPADRIVVPPPVRPNWFYGVPSKPVAIGSKVWITLDVIRTSGWPAEYEGVTVCEYDWQELEFIKLGRLPDEAAFTFPEASFWQRRDGSVALSQRTTAAPKSQKLSTCPANEPNNWTAPAVYEALGTNTASKARFAKSPTTGALYCAYNKSSARLNMTLAVSLDDGETFDEDLDILVAAGSGTGTPNGNGAVSYPDITFDASGNLYVVHDYGRAYLHIIQGMKIVEADAIAGTATPTAFVVDDTTPVPAP